MRRLRPLWAYLSSPSCGAGGRLLAAMYGAGMGLLFVAFDGGSVSALPIEVYGALLSVASMALALTAPWRGWRRGQAAAIVAGAVWAFLCGDALYSGMYVSSWGALIWCGYLIFFEARAREC